MDWEKVKNQWKFHGGGKFPNLPPPRRPGRVFQSAARRHSGAQLMTTPSVLIEPSDFLFTDCRIVTQPYVAELYCQVFE